MRTKDINLSRIDWSKRTSDLADQLNLATDRVSALRRIHAPHTLRARRPKTVKVVLDCQLGQSLMHAAAKQGRSPASYLAARVMGQI